MNPTVPVEHNDPINATILAVSEDLIAEFQRQPFQLIAEKSGVPFETVIERIRAMLEAGVVRRVRQTLLSTKLAHGALVDWLGSEKSISGLCQLIFCRPQRHRSTCHIASPTHFTPGWRSAQRDPGLPAHYKVNLTLRGTVSS